MARNRQPATMRSIVPKVIPLRTLPSMTHLERAYACIRTAVDELGYYAEGDGRHSLPDLNACIASIVKLEAVAQTWKPRTRWRRD